MARPRRVTAGGECEYFVENFGTESITDGMTTMMSKLRLAFIMEDHSQLGFWGRNS